MSTMTAGTTGAPATGRWTPGRVVLLVVGTLTGLLALAALAGGIALLVANAVGRDAQGFFTSPSERFATPTAALTSSDVVLEEWPSWLIKPERLGRLRISADGAGPLFVGIARTADVDSLLAGVARDRVTDVDSDPFRPTYERVAGTAAAAAPMDAKIWAASSSGAGEQSFVWTPAEGNWTIVVMNADGAPGVVADVEAGVKVFHLGWLAAGLLAAGGVLVLVAVGAIYAGGIRGRR